VDVRQNDLQLQLNLMWLKTARQKRLCRQIVNLNASYQSHRRLQEDRLRAEEVGYK